MHTQVSAGICSTTVDAINGPSRSGMTQGEWSQATKFDNVDVGWILISIGMAIGAGIVFLPVQVGVMGLWVFLLSAIIGYPAMYYFQKLFINTLAESELCKDYTGMITGYLGKNWGISIGILYFLMLLIWVLIYSLSITNDSASYLKIYGLVESNLSDNVWYGLVLICLLAYIGAKGEKVLFKLSGIMSVIVLLSIACMGALLIPQWSIDNIPELSGAWSLIKDAIITLPFTLTSILFIQSLSPMVISYRAKEKSIEVARYKSARAMKIAFWLLFVIVFFFAISFTLGLTQEQAIHAQEKNISALAMVASYYPGSWATNLGIVINIFGIVTSFFGVFLAFQEACRGIVINLLQRKYKSDEIKISLINKLVTLFIILFSWAMIETNMPILS